MKVTFILLLLLCEVISQSKDFYVSSTGNNTNNDCQTSTYPCQSLDYALGQIDVSDSTINIMSTLTGEKIDQTIKSNFSVQITGYQGTATISFSDIVFNSTSYDPTVTVSFQDITFTNSTLLSKYNTILDGNIFTTGSSVILVSTGIINDCQFMNSHNSPALELVGINFNISGSTFDGNMNNQSAGGAILISSTIGSSKVQISNSTFSNNYASIGAGISILGNIDISIYNVNIFNNYAWKGSSFSFSYSNFQLTLNDSTFYHNNATEGTFYFTNSYGNINTVSNSMISKNYVENGGAFASEMSTVNVINGSLSISQNMASNFGGVLYSDDSNWSFAGQGNLIMTMMNNSAQTGGAIYADTNSTLSLQFVNLNFSRAQNYSALYMEQYTTILGSFSSVNIYTDMPNPVYCPSCNECPVDSCSSCGSGTQGCLSVVTASNNASTTAQTCVFDKVQCWHEGTCTKYDGKKSSCDCTSDYYGNCLSRKPMKYVLIVVFTVLILLVIIAVIIVAVTIYGKKKMRSQYSRINE